MLNLSASALYTYYRPSKCALRTYLQARGEPQEPPSAYEEVIERLGRRHEAGYLATVGTYADLRRGTTSERARRTVEAIAAGTPVLFHPMFISDVSLGGQSCTIVGEPDLLINVGDRHIVCDCKIARRVSEKEHPEILRQVELYGWLYEQTSGVAPAGLRVISGSGDVIDLEYDGGVRALGVLEEIVKIRTAANEPIAPVGWTWCGPCCFHERCWKIAEDARDVALVSGVDRPLALELYKRAVRTYDALIEQFDVESLGEVRRRHGNTMKRVGTAAQKIISAARALSANAPIWLADPVVPQSPSYVMFDLEGLPPQLDDLEKVYLWGLQVRGQRDGRYVAVTAGFGPDGDREGWLGFLAAAREIFSHHGDVPFVHWATYEKTKLARYIERFGDAADGTAERVKANLVDLLPITQAAVVLPISSYSLKVVEKYVGFKRALAEANGDWSMAAFIEAVETNDPVRRESLMDAIRQYNREDLDATWAVMNWLRDASVRT